MEAHLLPNQHLPRRREIASGESVEIETTRHRLTELVFAIPIRRSLSMLMFL